MTCPVHDALDNTLPEEINPIFQFNCRSFATSAKELKEWVATASWERYEHPLVPFELTAYRAVRKCNSLVLGVEDLDSEDAIYFDPPHLISESGTVAGNVRGYDLGAECEFATALIGPSEIDPQEQILWMVSAGYPQLPSRVSREWAGKVLHLDEAKALGIRFVRISPKVPR